MKLVHLWFEGRYSPIERLRDLLCRVPWQGAKDAAFDVTGLGIFGSGLLEAKSVVGSK